MHTVERPLSAGNLMFPRSPEKISFRTENQPKREEVSCNNIMLASLALLLCTAFVLFLLRLEKRASPRVSAVTWLPTLWLTSIACKPLGIWLGSRGNIEAGSLPDRLILTCIGVASIVVLARRRFDWKVVLRRHAWLLILLGYMLVSTIWSEMTLIALRRWFRDAIIVIVMLVLVSEANPREALESVLRRLAYMLIPFSLVLVKYYPALGRQYSRWSGTGVWTGVADDKNSFGRLCVLCAFFLGWSLYNRMRERQPRSRYLGRADFLVLLLSLFLLTGAEKNSATAMATFVIGIATYLVLVILRKRKVRIPKFALQFLVLFLIGYGTAAPFLGGTNLAIFSSALGRDATLTDRTEIWAAVIPRVSQHPWLGVGHGSFWTTQQRRLAQGTPHAHNGYLDILLEEGVVGLALYSAWLVACAGKLLAALAKDYEWSSLALSFLMMTLVSNATESSLNSFTELLVVVFVLSVVIVSYRPISVFRQRKIELRPETEGDNPLGVRPFGENTEQGALSSSL